MLRLSLTRQGFQPLGPGAPVASPDRTPASCLRKKRAFGAGHPLDEDPANRLVVGGAVPVGGVDVSEVEVENGAVEVAKEEDSVRARSRQRPRWMNAPMTDGFVIFPASTLIFSELPRALGVLLPEVDPLAEPVPLVAARLHRLAGDQHAVGRGLVAAVEASDDAVAPSQDPAEHLGDGAGGVCALQLCLCVERALFSPWTGRMLRSPEALDRAVIRAYDHRMERLSLSLPEDLAVRIRAAALADGASLSAWLARAAESQLLLRNASKAIAAWEHEHGEITEAELAAVERAWRV